MVFHFFLVYDKSARSLQNSKRLPKVSSLVRNKRGATKGTHKTIAVRECVFIALAFHIFFYSSVYLIGIFVYWNIVFVVKRKMCTKRSLFSACRRDSLSQLFFFLYINFKYKYTAYFAWIRLMCIMHIWMVAKGRYSNADEYRYRITGLCYKLI